MNLSTFEHEWVPTEKDNKLHELAKRYHSETEAYDRTVCSGPVISGSIQPLHPSEMFAVNRNAHKVYERIAQEAAGYGISRAELWRAIGKESGA